MLRRSTSVLPFGESRLRSVVMFLAVALVACSGEVPGPTALPSAVPTGIALTPAPATSTALVATLSPSATTPPVPTASPSAGPSARPRCPNREGGALNTCLGAMEAGTYKTITFLPPLTYTVPAGWSNLEDLPGNFLLLPPGATLPGVNGLTSDFLGVYAAVGKPGKCTSAPDVSGDPFDQLVDFLTNHPDLDVTGVQDVSIGGLDGLVMDVALLPGNGDGCAGADAPYVDVYAGLGRSELTHGVDPSRPLRIYLLHSGEHALAIEIADPEPGSEYDDWIAAADEVVSSFSFGSP